MKPTKHNQKLLAILAFPLCLCASVVNLFSSTINGYYQSAAGVALTGQVHYDPVAVNPNGTYLVGTPRVSITLTNGGWTNSLTTGNYQVSFSATRDKFLIAVPNDSATYNINNLATTSPTYPQPSLLIFQGRNEKGRTNGYAPLDANSKVPTNNLPDSFGAGITGTTGDVISTGPGVVPATIADGAVTTSKIGLAAVVETNLAPASVSAAAIQQNAVDNNAIAPLAVTPGKLNDTSRFDAGQFLGDPSTQDVKIQPAVTSASGASINWDWSDGQPTILRITNTVDQTVTIINVPTLLNRAKPWKLELIADGTHTLTFAGAPLVLRSGVFINPPPSGLNEYAFERSNGTNYYDVLRPAFATSKRFWARNSAGAGDVEETSLDQAFEWPDANTLGDTWWFDGTNWRHLGIGGIGEFYKVLPAGIPGWGSLGSAGFDFTVTGLSTNATPVNLWTNTIAENTTVRLHAVATGAGTTNSGTLTAIALARRNAGGSASLIDTNNSINLPSSPEPNAYWTLSGNDALLQVVGITNNYYTWDAYGWRRTIPNGTNTYTPFTAGFDGSNDYLVLNGSIPTGLTDGPQFTLAVGLDLTGSDGVDKFVLTARSASNYRFFMRRTSTNTMQFRAADSAGTILLNGISSGTYTANSPAGYVHWLIAADLSGGTGGIVHIYTNGVEDASVTWETKTEGTVDWSMTSPTFFIGSATTSAAERLPASYYNLWFNDSYVNDITKFLTASGRPVNPGPDGSAVTGSAPVLFFSGGGSGNSWTNTASSTQFTLTGSLGSPSPP